MTAREQAERVWTSLLGLGTRRLAALGLIGVAVFLVTVGAGFYLSRPSFETLYTGLDRQDVSRIASTLRDANVTFDLNGDGTTVLVRYGETARARMLLAEKGLPNNPNAGNELYDKLGSLGLTSFMQEVTRVRALEGELARSIQLMRGVKAARVHIVMPDEGSFRRTKQPPSASVIVRTEAAEDAATAKAVRHLVASAVPGMTANEVTVLNTDGVLLASGGDVADAVPGRMLTLEKTVSQEIHDNIRKTLTPYLGMRNFQISVAARLNTDKRQTNETIYNPDSRVERSVKVTKQNQTSQNSSSQSPATVERNLPQENTRADDGKQSNEENQKREELTNYEVSSKTISTVSGGYSIDNLSVAVLVNKASIMASLGGDKASAEAVAKQIGELQQLVASAAGANKERGDNIKVAAVDFIESRSDLEPVPPPPWTEMLMRQFGTLINAGTMLLVALLVLWFAVRPVTRMLLAAPTVPSAVTGPEFQSLADMAQEPVFALPEGAAAAAPAQVAAADAGEPNLIEDLTRQTRNTPQKRLEQIVEYDEEQAAAILKLWMHQVKA